MPRARLAQTQPSFSISRLRPLALLSTAPLFCAVSGDVQQRLGQSNSADIGLTRRRLGKPTLGRDNCLYRQLRTSCARLEPVQNVVVIITDPIQSTLHNFQLSLGTMGLRNMLALAVSTSAIGWMAEANLRALTVTNGLFVLSLEYLIHLHPRNWQNKIQSAD